MKRILPLLVISILVLSGLGAVASINEEEKEELITETIFFSDLLIDEGEKYISVELEEATRNSIKPGKPMLPVVTKVFTFPFGTLIDNVEVTFSDVIEQEITMPVEPSPEVFPLSINAVNKVKEPDTVMMYSDIDVYPEQRYGYRTASGLKDGEHVVYLIVHLNIVQYQPKENTIFYFTNAKIDITYNLPENPIIFADEYDLLIIAPPEFETALQRLVDHKNNLDTPVDTVLVTLDEIPSGVGVDEQEDIKYFIHDAVEDWGITYLLLVGAGVEGEELFPVRNAWLPTASYEDYFPSDLYYADIYNGTGGFSNWDYDGDGKYAEWETDVPNVDVFPDLYLGKLPCNNVNEVNVIIDKIINYKEHNKMMMKILQGGGDSVTGDPEGIYEDEYANEKVMEKLPGYSTTQLWGSNGQLTKQNIAKGFMDGVDFVDLSGHGSYASWASHPPNEEETWIPPETKRSPYTGFLYIDYDLFLIKNRKKLPVVVFTACSNNKYTMSADCIGWKTLSKKNGGGIATFAEAGIGYGPGGSICVDECIGWMEVKVFEELYNTKVLGQAWANCVSDYYTTFSADMDRYDFQTMVEFSMFGDPTLAIEDGDNPESFPMDIPIFLKFLQQHPHMFPIFRHLLGL